MTRSIGRRLLVIAVPATLLTILLGRESIRDVIAFPKTQKAVCPMTDAPSPVDFKQLRDLGIKIA